MLQGILLDWARRALESLEVCGGPENSSSAQGLEVAVETRLLLCNTLGQLGHAARRSALTEG